MKNSITKNKRLHYAAFLFLVLITALVVTACGSNTNGDGSADNSQEPKNDSKNPTFQTNYEISGFGVISTPGDNFGTFLEIDNVTLTGGEFSFSDWMNRVDFTSMAKQNSIVTCSNTRRFAARIVSIFRRANGAW